MTLTFKNRSFYVDKDLAYEYERRVRPLDSAGIDYIFVAFELDVFSDKIEDEFSDALMEELDVAAHLPKALAEYFSKYG